MHAIRRLLSVTLIVVTLVGVAHAQPIRRVRTETVEVNLTAFGYGQEFAGVFDLANPVAVDDGSVVMVDRLLQSLTKERGPGGPTRSIDSVSVLFAMEFLSDDQMVSSFGPIFLLGWNGTRFHSPSGGPMPFFSSGTIDAVRLRLTIQQEPVGAGGSAQFGIAGPLKLYFINGPNPWQNQGGIHERRTLDGLLPITMAESGASQWRGESFDNPVPLERLRLIVHWIGAGGSCCWTTESRMRLDEGPELILDDILSPSRAAQEGALKSSVSSLHVLRLDDETRESRRDHSIEGWRWRIHKIDGGSVTALIPPGGQVTSARDFFFFYDDCPPPVVTRTISSTRDPQESCGDFLAGDSFPVELTLSHVREADALCGDLKDAGVTVRDVPPAGWTVSGISGNGVFLDGAVDWILEEDSVSDQKTLSYTITAAEPAGLGREARWRGTVVENAEGSWEAAIGGDVKITLARIPETCDAPAVSRRRVRTEEVPVRLIVEGYDEDVSVVVPLPNAVSLEGVSNVYMDTLRWTVRRSSGNGQYGVVINHALLRGGSEVASTGGRFGVWDGTGVSRSARISLPTLDSGTVDAIKVSARLDTVEAGSPDAQARIVGIHPGNILKLHFLSGSDPWLNDLAPHERRRLRNVPGQTLGTDGATTDWATTPFSEPVPLERLKFLTHDPFSSFGFCCWTSESRFVLDDNSALTLDDVFSPSRASSEGIPGPRVNQSHSLVLDEEATNRLGGRNIVGWEWRLHKVFGGDATANARDPMDFYFYYDDCPPAVVTREILATRDPRFESGDFLSGDEVPIELTVSRIRAADELCEAVAGVTIRERPPRGWVVSDVSDGGVVSDGVVEWTLDDGALVEGKVVTYTATAKDTPTATWGGVVLEAMTLSEERSITGESRLVHADPFDACGGIRVWNVLGFLAADTSDLDRDFLTDGVIWEDEFIWFPGARIDTDFRGASSSTELVTAPPNTGGELPEVLPWNGPDSRVDLHDDVFRTSHQLGMAYSQCHVINRSGAPLAVSIEFSTSSPLRILLNGELVAFHDVFGPTSDACEPLAAADMNFDGKPDVLTLDEGENSLVVKTASSYDWNFSLRLVDGNGDPMTEGIDIRKVPDGVVCIDPPLVARRTVETTETVPLEHEEVAAWTSGRTYDVVIALSDMRAAAGDCSAPFAVSLEEKIPTNWTVIPESVSGDGSVEDEVITWSLDPNDGLTEALSYRVTAGGELSRSRFLGSLREEGSELAFPVEGDRELVNPSGFSREGFINYWLLLGPLETCITPLQSPGCPGEEVIRRDFLADREGVVESDVEPAAGSIVEPDYNGAASSCRLADRALFAPINPGGVPTWFAWNDRDDTVDFEDYYGGDVNNVMMYAVTYVDLENELDLSIGLASDDAVQVFVNDEEIWLNNICRDAFAANEVQDIADSDLLVPLERGVHRILVKVFEQGGQHRFRLRFQDPFSFEPVTDGIRVLLSGPEPEVTFVRGDPNADGAFNLTDGVFILRALFSGGTTPTCLEAADTNGDRALNLTDGVYVLRFLFAGGSNPPAPHPECGSSVHLALGCESFAACP